MLRIGLISDTHGYIDPKVFDLLKDVDEVWHAGDLGTVELCDELEKFKPFYAVFGNIDNKDIRIRYPENWVTEKEGLKILMTHIGGYPGHYAPKARKAIVEHQPDIFICGHSHILRVGKDPAFNNMLAMNPGAAGVQGFHKVKTLLRFTLNQGKIENLEAVEMGKRGQII